MRIDYFDVFKGSAWISDKAMFYFYNNFSTCLQVVSQKEVIVLRDVSFKTILNWDNAKFCFLRAYFVKDFFEILARFDFGVCSKELEDRVFAVGASLSL